MNQYSAVFDDGFILRSESDGKVINARSNTKALKFLRTVKDHRGELIHGPELKGIKSVINLRTNRPIYPS